MNGQVTTLGRRAFLKGGSLVLAAAGLDLGLDAPLFAGEQPAPGGLRVGLITDLHHADKPPAGTRFYRETLGKLAEAAQQFAKDRPAFVVELGDLIDAADTVETELAYLKRINGVFSAIAADRHYVLGNHCVDMLRKEEFLDGVGQKRSHYSFDAGGVHFVILDACFRRDGQPYGRKNSQWTDANIPAAEVDWLKEDLKATDKKVVVFAHQRLDVANDYGIKNAPEVRKVLEGSGRVLAVFQGHSHKNDYKEIAGIHYCTLVGMIEGAGAENNGYSMMEVQPAGTITLTGFRKQKGYEWKGRLR
jgi:alkaline phosphatase